MRSPNLFILTLLTIFLAGCSGSFPGCGSSDVAKMIREEILKKYDKSLADSIEVNVSIAEEISFDTNKSVRQCKAIASAGFQSGVVSKFEEFEADFKKAVEGRLLPYSYKKSDQKIHLKEQITIQYAIKKNEVDKGHFIEGAYTSDMDFKLNPIVLKLLKSKDEIIAIAKPYADLIALRDTAEAEKGSTKEVVSIVTQRKIKIDFCQLVPAGYEFNCKFTNNAGEVILTSLRSNGFESAVTLFKSKPNSELKLSDPADIAELFSIPVNFKFKNLEDKSCSAVPAWCEAFGM
jgi:hypothetical protein